MSSATTRRRRLSVLVGSMVLLAVPGNPAVLAGGGGPCQYDSVPANSQGRGQQVTVSGTFGEQHQNGAIQVRLRAGATEYTLAPDGVADGDGDFEHTVTIPAGTPIGAYDLITVGPGPPDNPVLCSKPFAVTQGGGLVTPTTTPAPTTTTLGLATPTITAPTTTTPEASTTSLAETTSTTADLVASDDTGSSGVPLWLILALVFAIAAAITSYVLGRRRPT